MRKTISALISLYLFSQLASFAAIDFSDSVMVLGQAVHRSAIEPVHSTYTPTVNVIDTLPTSVPGVNVLLYNDNSWRYSKSDKFIAENDVFTEFWDNEHSDAYKVSVDSLAEYWSIWLVDSLGSYHSPATGRVTSKFGIRYGRRHQGVDVSLPTGTPLYATFDGKVRISKYIKGYGNLIVIRHNNGLETFYGHMSRRDLEVNDIVRAGDVIGLSGNTGRSTGPHLHYECRYHGLAFDPQRIVNMENGDLKQRMMVLKRRYFDSASAYDQSFDDEFLNEEDDKKALEEQRKKQEEAARKAMAYHIIRSGDTLSGLAKKYHTTVNAICRLNGISSTTTLKIGRKLRVR